MRRGATWAAAAAVLALLAWGVDGAAAAPASGPAAKGAAGAVGKPASRPAAPAVAPLAAEAERLDDAQRVEREKKAAAEFNRILGRHVRDALATPAPNDDLALSEKLMAMQGQAADDVFFAAAMCEKAAELAGANPAGQATALAALEQLRSLAPWKNRTWLEAVVEIRRKTFAACRGEERTREGNALIADTLRLAEAMAEDDAFNEAYEACHRLLPTAKAIKSDQADELELAQDQYAALKPIGHAMTALQIRIKANPADQLARNELMRLYVVERNAPRKAAAYLTPKAPQDYQANIPDAQRSLAAMDAGQSLRLGLWYEGLIDRASEQGKALTARRSRDYLQQYLDLHETADAQRVKASAAVKKLDALLASLAEKKNRQAMKFVRTLDLSNGRLVSNSPAHFRNPYAQRTVDMWVLPGKDDGIILDQGSTRAGMAVALFKDRIHFAMCDAKEHTRIVHDEKGNNRTEAIPAADLSGPLGDRTKWCHIAAQYANGHLSLWINGKLAAERQIGTPAVPGDAEGAAVGGGYGSNAGYWDSKGFGGKVAAIRFSNRARYNKNFDPEEQMGTTGAFAFVCADRLSTGELDRSGTRDSVASSYIVWSALGQVRVVNVE